MGSLVATAIADLGLRHVSPRLQMFAEDLAASAATVDQSMVDWTYVESDEFSDIVLACIDAARFTRSRLKLRTLARVLVGLTDRDRPMFTDFESLVRALAGLTPSALSLLDQMHQLKGTQPDVMEDAVRPPDVEDAGMLLTQLIAAGFIEPAIGPTYGYGGAAYFLTDAFERVLHLIHRVRRSLD